MWKKVDPIVGTLVEGDKAVPATRWWNHLWLALFGWRTIVTFHVPSSLAAAGYHVGFTPLKGAAMHQTEVSHGEYFSMRIGHEDCKFFALPVDPTKPPCSPTITSRSKLH